jgi:hypothetical protein
MKKLAILSIAFVAVSFASCKKDYTCTCTSSGTTINKIVGVSKKTAQAQCVSYTSNGYTETCVLSK